MMGSGTVPIPARVAVVNSIVINHLGDTMAHFLTQVKHNIFSTLRAVGATLSALGSRVDVALEKALENSTKIEAAQTN